ncbi:MAG: hypothetical protein V3S68_09740, partial [Dehalococcoidia bacterium]
MNCHICGQPATGQCRVCWKFYCAEHGDRVCQTCQQQQEAATGAPPGWDRMGPGVPGQHRTPGSPRPPRPPGPDIERQTLQRVLGVGKSIQHGDAGETEVTLLSLELFESGFIANFRLRGWGPGENPHADFPQPGFIRSPTFYAEAVDDHGNNYQSFPGRGGGGRAQWRMSHRFSPELAVTDGQLHITIEEIQWSPQGAGVRTMIETGPWQF